MSVIDTVEINNCRDCSCFSQGFMSEPNECGWYNEPYKHLVDGEGIPDWCPKRK